MWWDEQDEDTKTQMRQWVKEGRWEFLNGGMSANDEACPSYQDIIVNMMAGRDFLMKEFGIAPKNGWLVDSYGHSAGNARIYADMGIEALFVARIDRMDKEKRYEEKSL